MTALFDPRNDLVRVKDDLSNVEAEISRLALANVPGGEGDLDRLAREKARLIAQRDAIDSFAKSPNAAALDAQLAEDERRRDADGRAVADILDRLPGMASAIENDTPLAAMRNATTSMFDAILEARSLWLSHVDESRRDDRLEFIRRVTDPRVIRSWLERTAYNAQLTDRHDVLPITAAPMETLKSVMTNFVGQIRRALAHEFPALTE